MLFCLMTGYTFAFPSPARCTVPSKTFVRPHLYDQLTTGRSRFSLHELKLIRSSLVAVDSLCDTWPCYLCSLFRQTLGEKKNLDFVNIPSYPSWMYKPHVSRSGVLTVPPLCQSWVVLPKTETCCFITTQMLTQRENEVLRGGKRRNRVNTMKSQLEPGRLLRISQLTINLHRLEI